MNPSGSSSDNWISETNFDFFTRGGPTERGLSAAAPEDQAVVRVSTRSLCPSVDLLGHSGHSTSMHLNGSPRCMPAEVLILWMLWPPSERIGRMYMQRRLLIGIGATVALAGLSQVPTDSLRGQPSRPLFQYLAPLLRIQACLKPLIDHERVANYR